MTTIVPPTYSFPGILYNPKWWTASTAGTTLTQSTANTLYLRKTVPDSSSSLETFNAGIKTNSIFGSTTTSNMTIGSTTGQSVRVSNIECNSNVINNATASDVGDLIICGAQTTGNLYVGTNATGGARTQGNVIIGNHPAVSCVRLDAPILPNWTYPLPIPYITGYPIGYMLSSGLTAGTISAGTPTISTIAIPAVGLWLFTWEVMGTYATLPTVMYIKHTGANAPSVTSSSGFALSNATNYTSNGTEVVQTTATSYTLVLTLTGSFTGITGFYRAVRIA